MTKSLADRYTTQNRRVGSRHKEGTKKGLNEGNYSHSKSAAGPELRLPGFDARRASLHLQDRPAVHCGIRLVTVAAARADHQR